MRKSTSSHASSPWTAMGTGLTTASILYPEQAILLIALGISSLLVAWLKLGG